MRENGNRRERTNWLNGRWAGRVSGVGALGIVALMALLPAATAVSSHVSLLGTSTPNLYESAQIQGCSKASAAMPKLSLPSGLGSDAGLKAASKTCSKLLGGVGTISSAYAGAQVGLSKTLKLPFAASTINASFDVKAAVMTAAAGTFKTCPSSSYKFNYTTFSGNQTSTVYYSDTSSYCAAEASWTMFTEMFVDDTTAGTFSCCGSSYMSNSSGNYYDKYSYTYNYSNPNASLGWTNSTGGGTFSKSYGASNSTTIAWTPTSIVTGSWAKGDRLQISVYLYIEVYTTIEYEHGSAAAKLLASGVAGHVDITGFTIS